MKNGNGVLKTSDGSYRGNFIDDYLEGEGTFIWKDGKIYDGEFKGSKFHGKGKIYYPTNQVAEGIWENNHNKSLIMLKNTSQVSSIIEEIKNNHEQNKRREEEPEHREVISPEPL